MENEVIVSTCTHPLSSKRIEHIVIEGSSISDILDMCKIPKEAYTRITINGSYLRTDNYARIVKAGDIVTIRVVPSGGGDKNIFATIASILVIVAAALVTGGAAAGILGSSFAAGTTGAALLGAATMAVGTLLVNSIFPPPDPDGGGASSTGSQIYSISGARNTVSPYGVRPQILGIHRFTPPYGAVPYTELSGDDQYLRLLFDFGYGPLSISDIRIGETSIDEFDDVEYEVFEGYPGDGVPTLYTNDIYQEPLSINLLQNQGQVRTTQPDADEISVDLTVPGLIYFHSDGDTSNRAVDVEVEYAPAGTSNWVAAPASFHLNERTSTVIRRSVKWAVTTGQYDVRLTRTTEDTPWTNFLDDTIWTGLKTIKNISPINLETKPVLLAMRIKATEQLNGIIDQLNAICTLNCLDWDTGTSTWIERETNNPASIFRYVLQGAANHRPMADSLIDLESLQNWHVFCNTNGLAFDHVKDYRSSIWETLDMICSAGRGSTTRIDGRLGVIYDHVQTVPIQHFTPRNSWDFSSNKKFISPIHGWKVPFLSEHEDWREDERIVYDDGYSEANATKFETLRLPGVTNQHAAWKHGKYHAASLRLRPEMYSFYTDVEYLVCARGDLIKLAHDVILVGLGVGRVKSTTENAGYVETVTTDEIFTMEAGKTYCIRARQSDGTSVLLTVNTAPGDSNVLTLTDLVLASNAPAVGDLVMFGESESETINCIIKSIFPSSDLTAQIVCVDQAPDIYNSDSGTIPPFTSPLTSRLTLPAPVIYSVASDKRAVFNNFIDPIQIRILVELTPPSGKIEVVQTIECQYRVANSIGPWQSQTFSPGSTSLYLINIASGLSYDIRVRYLSLALTSEWTYHLDHLVTGLTDQPVLLPRISGLELFNEGNGDEFTGNHAKFVWRAASITNSYDIDDSEFGIDDGSLDLYFKDYEIRIYDGTTLLRTEHTTDNSYTYTYEKNVEDYQNNHDGASGAYRTFTIEVYMRGAQNQLSYLPAKITATNPAPELPSNISVRTSFRTLFVSYTPPTDLDFVGVRVWIGTAPGFVPAPANLVYEGVDTAIIIDALPDETQLDSGVVYYIQIQSFDGFGYEGTKSVTLSATTVYIDGTFDIEEYSIGHAQIGNLEVWNAAIKDLVVDKLQSGTITGKDFNVSTDGRIRSGQTDFNTGSGWWLGHTGGYPKMSVGSPTGNGWDWSAQTGTMNFRGTMTFQAGSSGYSNLTDKPTDLSGINTTEGTKLTGIADDADVTGDNTAASISGQGDLATLSVVETAQLGTTVITGGFIKTALLTADNVIVGTFDAARVGSGTIVESSGYFAHIGNSTFAGRITGTRYDRTNTTGGPALSVYDTASSALEYAFGVYSQYAGAALFKSPSQAYGTNIVFIELNSANINGLQLDGTCTNHAVSCDVSTPNVSGYFQNTGTGLGIYGVTNNAAASAHGIRGKNLATGATGLVGAANNFDFYADGAGTNYGPFTGAHEALVPIGHSLELGDIVIDELCVEKRNLSNTIFEVSKSKSINQKSVVGVVAVIGGPLDKSYTPTAFIASEEVIDDPHHKPKKGLAHDEVDDKGMIKPAKVIRRNPSSKYEEVKKDYTIININALGEGQMSVCGENGDIKAGDFITTSNMPGKGMKQNDDILHNYTVAKARESVSFRNKQEIKMIPCIYLCG